MAKKKSNKVKPKASRDERLMVNFFIKMKKDVEKLLNKLQKGK